MALLAHTKTRMAFSPGKRKGRTLDLSVVLKKLYERETGLALIEGI
jgi:hypothetical protein